MTSSGSAESGGATVVFTEDLNDGQQYGAYLGGGYKIHFGDNLEFTPLADLQWNHLSLNSYTEYGADSLDLNVNKQSYDVLQSGVGASISTEEIYYWGIFTPEIHAKWLYDFVDDNIAVTSSLTRVFARDHAG